MATFLIAGVAHAQAPVNIPAGNNTSTNWAGYVAQGSSYTGVGATWVVPTPTISDSDLQADATWVGIGGVSSNDLIQAGTQAMTENSSVSYQVWYETLPDVQEVVPMTVNGGDSVTVSMSENTNHLWTITFNDNTTGASDTINVSYQSSNSSAEWIEERPTGIEGNEEGYFPLDNFDDVDFTGAYLQTDYNASDESPASAGAQALSMTSDNTGSDIIAEPSALEDNGTAFLITRETDTTPSFTPSQYGPRYVGPNGRTWHRVITQTFVGSPGESKTFNYTFPGGTGSISFSFGGSGTGEALVASF